MTTVGTESSKVAPERRYKFIETVVTDVGRRRSENQDAYSIAHTGGVSLYIVADGMGGARGGATASAIAVNVIAGEAIQADGTLSPQSLKAAIERANKVIFAKSRKDEELAGMGTTVVALAFAGEKTFIAHVGDSRIYRYCDNQLTQLTRDHTLVQELVDTGAIPAEEAANHPIAHMLTRSLGPTGFVEVELEVLPDKERTGERFLLCSDGLYNLVSDEELKEALATKSPEEAARLLVDLALERGGNDNITVEILEVCGVGDNSVDIQYPTDGQVSLQISGRMDVDVLNELMATADDDDDDEVTAERQSAGDPAGGGRADSEIANGAGPEGAQFSPGVAGDDDGDELSDDGGLPQLDLDDDHTSVFLGSDEERMLLAQAGERFAAEGQETAKNRKTLIAVVAVVALLIVFSLAGRGGDEDDSGSAPAGAESGTVEPSGALTPDEQLAAASGGETQAAVDEPRDGELFGEQAGEPAGEGDGQGQAKNELLEQIAREEAGEGSVAETAAELSAAPEVEPSESQIAEILGAGEEPAAEAKPPVDAAGPAEKTPGEGEQQTGTAPQAQPEADGGQAAPAAETPAAADAVPPADKSVVERATKQLEDLSVGEPPKIDLPAAETDDQQPTQPIVWENEQQKVARLKSELEKAAQAAPSPQPSAAVNAKADLSADEVRKIVEEKKEIRERIRDLDVKISALGIESEQQRASEQIELESQLKEVNSAIEVLRSDTATAEDSLIRWKRFSERAGRKVTPAFAEEVAGFSAAVKTGLGAYHKAQSDYENAVNQWNLNPTEISMATEMSKLGRVKQKKEQELAELVRKEVRKEAAAAEKRIEELKANAQGLEQRRLELSRQIGYLDQKTSDSARQRKNLYDTYLRERQQLVESLDRLKEQVSDEQEASLS